MILRLIRIKLSGVMSSAASGKGSTPQKLSKGKIALFAFLYIYLAAFFAAFAAFMANSMGAFLIPYGFEKIYFGIFTVVVFTIIFILSIFETKATLYEGRDNELLLSMPIAVRDIIISRISVVLIYNYIECAILMVPVTVVYAIYGGSILGIVGSIAVSVFVPLLATSLASGVGYLVAQISRRIKYKTFITVILSLIFLAAYFVGYNYLLNSMEMLVEVSPELAAAFAENMGFFGVIGTCALLNPISISVLILLSVGISLLAYILISRNYITIITGRVGSTYKAYKADRQVMRSAFTALTVKELRAFFSSANYILNAGLGAVFGIVISVMVLVKRADILVLTAEIAMLFPEMAYDIEGAIAVLASAVLFAASSMTFISAPALSLEGKSLWILKSLPISGRAVLLAKTMPHILITSVISLVSSVVMIIALGLSPVWWAFVILIPLAGSLFGAFSGAVIGALFPKFNFTSEIQVIKQSLASFVSMFSTMIIGIGVYVGVFFLMKVLSPMLTGIILLAVLIMATAVLAAFLMTKLAKKFDSI